MRCACVALLRRKKPTQNSCVLHFTVAVVRVHRVVVDKLANVGALLCVWMCCVKYFFK